MSKSLAALGWLLLSCFTAINLFTAAALYRASNASRRPKPAPREYSYVGCDYPPQLPLDISPAALVVNTTHRYGLTADDDWGTIFPNGNGWVRLGPDGRAFAVSMYHQLHCLDAIRVAMVRPPPGNTLIPNRS
ncbi:hypothetical protein SCP_1500610 [Sparassis crispa]|uniref:Uncharacterized protein n=1 Tax=Sparassis crispa TaxID=139825 RepID=A0A401H3U7_9APHY|nr:hypothetical protein SCP_1500610 [Sparassis crispa]GBE89059.1 hypothetical protein SCP_1500610 [Sparassis crispa]